MSSARRFALLVFVDVSLYLAFLSYSYAQGWDMSKRPLDLQWQNPQDFHMLMTLLVFVLSLTVVSLRIVLVGQKPRPIRRAE